MSELDPKEAFQIPEGSSLAFADILIHELLKMLHDDAANASSFERLADRLQVPTNPQARIYFFTQLYQQVREFPLRLFKTPEIREELLYAVQDALDSAIISEE